MKIIISILSGIIAFVIGTAIWAFFVVNVAFIIALGWNWLGLHTAFGLPAFNFWQTVGAAAIAELWIDRTALIKQITNWITRKV